MKRLIPVFIVLIGVACLVFAQDCLENVEYIQTDTCKYVRMNVPTFTGYFIAKRNLETIGNTVNPELKIKFDSLIIVHAQVVAAHELEKALAEAKADTTRASYDEVMNMAIEIDEENGKLWQENDFLKKKALPAAVVVGVIVGILIPRL